MGTVINFPAPPDDLDGIDLLDAVDWAIRDLSDIAARVGDAAVRLQAEECREMLQRALQRGPLIIASLRDMPHFYAAVLGARPA